MKRKLLLPVLAVVFAVTGAFASNRFAITYYASTDTECEVEIDAPLCTPGDDEVCVEFGQTFRYSDDVNSINCEQLLKESGK